MAWEEPICQLLRTKASLLLDHFDAWRAKIVDSTLPMVDTTHIAIVAEAGIGVMVWRRIHVYIACNTIATAGDNHDPLRHSRGPRDSLHSAFHPFSRSSNYIRRQSPPPPA